MTPNPSLKRTDAGLASARSAQTLGLINHPCQPPHYVKYNLHHGRSQLNPSLRSRLSACTAIFFVVGCATAYQPSGMTGGYSEKKVAEGRYWLKFLGNGFTDPETVRQYWNRRAAELCGGRPFKGDAQAGRDEKTNFVILATGAYSTRDSYPTVEGIVECGS